MLSLYMYTFLTLAKEVLIYLFYRNIFFWFFHSGVTVNSVLHTTPEEKIMRIKI